MGSLSIITTIYTRTHYSLGLVLIIYSALLCIAYICLYTLQTTPFEASVTRAVQLSSTTKVDNRVNDNAVDLPQTLLTMLTLAW